MKVPCKDPLPVEVLADYWAAALEASEEERIEEHLLSCDRCGAQLREIIALGGTVRSMARAGELRVVLSQAFLDRAKKEGLRVRQYAPPNGGSVECTVAANDDLLVAHLAANVTEAKRLDLRYTDPGGTRRITDIPFNPSSAEMLLSVNLSHMRTMPKHVARIELIQVDNDTDKIVGEYTFNHTPMKQ